MVEILVRGGDAEAAATQLARAVGEIFAVEPARSSIAPAESMRGPVEVWTLILTIPPAILAMVDLAARLKLVERIDRLIASTHEQR
jgi:hypothetical protein